MLVRPGLLFGKGRRRGLPLDLVTGAAAFSTRKLRSAYSGSALRLRESSGNTESDIGFDAAGNLDTAAATAFLNGASGFVSKWYDQSGNGNDAVQATAASQFSYVAGATPTSRPVIRGAGSGASLSVASAASVDNLWDGGGYALFGVRFATTGGGGVGQVANKSRWNLQAATGGVTFQQLFSTTSLTFTGTAPSTGASAWVIAGLQYNSDAVGNVPTYRVNGSANGSVTTTPVGTRNTDVGQPLVLGNRSDGLRGLDGDLFEMLLFSTPPSAADQAVLEQSARAYFGAI